MNNFNQSSTGLNIELDISRDTELSRFWFEDSFTVLNQDGFSLLNNRYRGVNIYAYQMPDFELFNLDNWNIPAKSVLLDLITNKLFNGCTGSLNTETKDQFGKTSAKLTKGELLEFIAGTYEPDYQDFIIENFKPKFGVVASRGYCQGDYVEVIYDKSEFEKEPDFDNEIWNTPIYARLTINDEEFYIDQEMKDLYEYDEDEVSSIIIKLIRDSDIPDTELAISEALAMVPSKPEYK